MTDFPSNSFNLLDLGFERKRQKTQTNCLQLVEKTFLLESTDVLNNQTSLNSGFWYFSKELVISYFFLNPSPSNGNPWASEIYKGLSKRSDPLKGLRLIKNSRDSGKDVFYDYRKVFIWLKTWWNFFTFNGICSRAKFT